MRCGLHATPLPPSPIFSMKYGSLNDTVVFSTLRLYTYVCLHAYLHAFWHSTSIPPCLCACMDGWMDGPLHACMEACMYVRISVHVLADRWMHISFVFPSTLNSTLNPEP